MLIPSLRSSTSGWLISKLGITDETAKKKIVQSRIMLFACLMHPNGARDKVLLAGKHFWVCFLVDDILESSPRDDYPGLKSTVWNLANGYYKGSSIDHPVLLLYKEVLDELRPAMSAPMFARYTKILASYLDAVREEVEYQLKDKVPSSHEYRHLRRRTGFMEAMACIMTEFCAGIQLREAAVNSPEVRELANLVDDHIVMVNDLLSLGKEYYGKNTCHNWVFVLSATTKTFQEAVDPVCAMIKEEEDSILALQEKMVAKAKLDDDAELLNLAYNVPMAVAGHLRWSYVTAGTMAVITPCLLGSYSMELGCLTAMRLSLCLWLDEIKEVDTYTKCLRGRSRGADLVPHRNKVRFASF